MKIDRRWLGMISVVLLISLSLRADGPPTNVIQNAVDEYIAKPDATYRWELLQTNDLGKVQSHILKMWSQTWRTKENVDRPEWEHIMVITIPSQVQSTKAFLLIGGGSHSSKIPSGPDALAASIAEASGCIVAELKNVPNQPLVFHGDGQPRVEDDLIAYGWSQYLESGDPTWIPRFPMIKSAVRAMDCVTEFAASETGGNHQVNKFIVGGASKRGWTTWMTAAVDSRVEAIVPIVIDVLNLDPSLRHHAQAYGFWAEAIGNYYQHRILQRFEHPRMPDLYSLEDPFQFRSRMTMPKYIVNGSGDQFFLPDSWRFYWNQLPGEKHLRYVPNADHGLKNSDAGLSIATFHAMIVKNIPRPQYSWEIGTDGSIEVTTATPPSKVTMWRANNPEARDFRLETIGAAFKATPLDDQGGGRFIAPPAPDGPGWTATFIELEFPVDGHYPFIASTGVLVSPERLPYQGVAPAEVKYELEVRPKREKAK